MKLGIFAKTFSGAEPEGVLASVAATGFSATQYNMACSGLPSMPDEISSDVAAAIHLAATRHGVEIVALSGTYNMIHPDPDVRALGLKRLEVLAAAASSLPTRLITLCTGTRDAEDQWRGHPDNETPRAWDDLLAAMEIAVGIAERYDVELGVEPELANVINSAVKARRLIDQIGSPRVKIVFDPANLFETARLDQQRDIVSSAIDLLADDIVMGHAKDRTATGDFTTAGKGVLDYPWYLQRLKEIGFSGALVTHGLAAGEAAGVAAFLGRTLAGIEA